MTVIVSIQQSKDETTDLSHCTCLESWGEWGKAEKEEIYFNKLEYSRPSSIFVTNHVSRKIGKSKCQRSKIKLDFRTLTQCSILNTHHKNTFYFFIAYNVLFFSLNVHVSVFCRVLNFFSSFLKLIFTVWNSDVDSCTWPVIGIKWRRGCEEHHQSGEFNNSNILLFFIF